MELTIRPVRDDDFPVIARIYADNWHKEYASLLPREYLDGLTYEKAEGKLRGYVEKPRHGMLAAVAEGKTIGFASWEPCYLYEHSLLLDSLHIDAAAQGSGVGKRLIYAVAREAAAQGFPHMSICIVRGNERAKGVYTHLGARFVRNFVDSFEGTPSNSALYVWDDVEELLRRCPFEEYLI